VQISELKRNLDVDGALNLWVDKRDDDNSATPLDSNHYR